MIKKGMVVLGSTVVAGALTGAIGGAIVTRALRYTEEEMIEYENREKVKFKDKVITGLGFTAGLLLVGIGVTAAVAGSDDEVIEGMDCNNDNELDTWTNEGDDEEMWVRVESSNEYLKESDDDNIETEDEIESNDIDVEIDSDGIDSNETEIETE